MLKLGFITFLLILLTGVSGHAAEVLIVTWRGKTDAEIGFEKKLKLVRPDVQFRYLDAARDKKKLASALREMDYTDVDLVYTFGTTASKMMKRHLKGKVPQVFNIVSYPVKTKITESLSNPGKEITGVSHLIAIETQFEIISKLRNVKTIGVWFDPREKNTIATVEDLRQYTKKTGKILKEYRVIVDSSNTDKAIRAASKDARKLDVLYIPASSAYVQKAEKLFSMLDQSVFVYGAINKYIGKGATIALAADYQERGGKAAELANSILSGVSAGSLPVQVLTPKNVKLYIDSKKAQGLDLTSLKESGLEVITR